MSWSYLLKKSLMENFIFCAVYNEESDEGYFLKLMLNILKNYMNFIMIYCFT